MLKDLVSRVKSEIDEEKRTREESQESLLGLLEEACNKMYRAAKEWLQSIIVYNKYIGFIFCYRRHTAFRIYCKIILLSPFDEDERSSPERTYHETQYHLDCGGTLGYDYEMERRISLCSHLAARNTLPLYNLFYTFIYKELWSALSNWVEYLSETIRPILGSLIVIMISPHRLHTILNHLLFYGWIYFLCGEFIWNHHMSGWLNKLIKFTLRDMIPLRATMNST